MAAQVVWAAWTWLHWLSSCLLCRWWLLHLLAAAAAAGGPGWYLGLLRCRQHLPVMLLRLAAAQGKLLLQAAAAHMELLSLLHGVVQCLAHLQRHPGLSAGL